MYKFIRPLLFKLDPEAAHRLALTSLHLAYKTGLSRFLPKPTPKPCTVMGLHFPHPIGLAAGFDRNAAYVDALSAFGFGFIEVGTITPAPQTGNPRPRIFRLVPEEGIINRMGFYNKGMEHAAQQLENIRYKGVLGINIGKNPSTPNEEAVNDYIACFQKLAPYASYITINISSPNTQGLRDLQEQQQLTQLLRALKNEQHRFNQINRYVPLVVKIAPDLTEGQLNELATVLLHEKIDGVIATNTTISRENVSSSPFASEAGGLSGKPLQSRSTDMIRQLKNSLGDQLPIIASGGVMDATAVQEKLEAGAKLVQVYSGFIYHGPGLLGTV